MKIRGSICGFMIGSLMATLLALTPTRATAQSALGYRLGGLRPYASGDITITRPMAVPPTATGDRNISTMASSSV